MRVRLTKDFQFEAAQTLPKAPEGHKCRKMHGHSFKVEIPVEGETDPETGWVYDHAQISDAVKPLIQQLDHSYLNEIAGLENPTIENMAAWFWEKLNPFAPGSVEMEANKRPTPAAGIAGNKATSQPPGGEGGAWGPRAGGQIGNRTFFWARTQKKN